MTISNKIFIGSVALFLFACGGGGGGASGTGSTGGILPQLDVITPSVIAAVIYGSDK